MQVAQRQDAPAEDYARRRLVELAELLEVLCEVAAAVVHEDEVKVGRVLECSVCDTRGDARTKAPFSGQRLREHSEMGRCDSLAVGAYEA